MKREDPVASPLDDSMANQTSSLRKVRWGQEGKGSRFLEENQTFLKLLKKKDLEVNCPDCGSRILVNSETGAVISHSQEEKPEDLLDVVRRLDGRQKAKSDAFDDALNAEKDRGQELDELFKKAADKNKSAEDGDKPDNPLDDRWR